MVDWRKKLFWWLLKDPLDILRLTTLQASHITKFWGAWFSWKGHENRWLSSITFPSDSKWPLWKLPASWWVWLIWLIQLGRLKVLASSSLMKSNQHFLCHWFQVSTLTLDFGNLSLEALAQMFSWLPRIFISWNRGKDILYHIRRSALVILRQIHIHWERLKPRLWDLTGCGDLVIGFCWMIFAELIQRVQLGEVPTIPGYSGYVSGSSESYKAQLLHFRTWAWVLISSGLANTPKISMGVASSIPAKWFRHPSGNGGTGGCASFKPWDFHFDLRLESCFNMSTFWHSEAGRAIAERTPQPEPLPDMALECWCVHDTTQGYHDILSFLRGEMICLFWRM